MPERQPSKFPELLDRKVVQEVEYSESHLTSTLVEEWLAISKYSFDPKNPEWNPTPLIDLDLARMLSDKRYAHVRVKDESHNPTGTIKDRAAWELAKLYQQFAERIQMKLDFKTLDLPLSRIPIPRVTLLTAGNEGRAIAACFEKFKLPPPKIIVGSDISTDRLSVLRSLRADIYQVDFSDRAFTGEELLEMSNNHGGVDLTSMTGIPFRPDIVYYDWHVHETFNECPDHIYVPYGSGRVFENYLAWQDRSFQERKAPDPRLTAPVEKVISISIHGGTPKNRSTKADKLFADFSPYVLFEDKDIRAARNLEMTGRNTCVEALPEDYIQTAYQIFQDSGIRSEPSGAAGLAQYLFECENKQTAERLHNTNIVIVNTGRGLYND